MMVIDDARIKLGLAGHNEFLMALDSFVTSFGLSDRPALIAQARRVDAGLAPPLDLDDADLLQRFSIGNGDRNGWWDGLRNGQRRETFRGVAFEHVGKPSKWAIEMHSDHHFIGGVFAFPELPNAKQEQVLCLSDFYAKFFPDFFARVAGLGAEQDAVSYDLTATLLNAPMLHFAGQSDWNDGHYIVRAAPLPVPNLQWPVGRASVGSPAWEGLARTMGRGLTGAYGLKPFQEQR